MALPEQEGKPTISLFLQIFYWGSCGNMCFASVRVYHWAKQWLAQGTERCTQIHACMTTCHSKDPTVPRPWPQALRIPPDHLIQREWDQLTLTTDLFLSSNYVSLSIDLTALNYRLQIIGCSSLVEDRLSNVHPSTGPSSSHACLPCPCIQRKLHAFLHNLSPVRTWPWV